MAGGSTAHDFFTSTLEAPGLHRPADRRFHAIERKKEELAQARAELEVARAEAAKARAELEVARAEAAKARAEAEAAKAALAKPRQRAGITFAIHGNAAANEALEFGPLKAEFESAAFCAGLFARRKTETPIQDRAKVMVEALKNVESDIVLVGISNHGLFMPLVAAERPIRRIVMINAVVPRPGKSFREAFDFKEVFATDIARLLEGAPGMSEVCPLKELPSGRVCLRLRRKGRRDTSGMGAAGRARVSACRTGRRQRRGPREYRGEVRERGRRRRDEGTLTNRRTRRFSGGSRRRRNPSRTPRRCRPQCRAARTKARHSHA